jgi:UDP-N-acetylmuramoyl-tripeptide--D-alanyl-D-alanine ligase
MYRKSAKTKILELLLKWMAHSVLWRHKPKVIGITGSVGKTTTKDVIVHILKQEKSIYFTKKNYNNEIGVPLTILGVDKNIDSFFTMFGVCGKWFGAMISAKYPEIIVVEMGVDRPGDMDYLMSIVNVDISVLTAVSYAHSEFFDDIEQIAQEKQKIVLYTKKDGRAIVNYDDVHARSVAKKTNTTIVFYGTKEGVDFRATDIDICFHQCHATGLSFKLNYKGKIIPVRLNNVIAKHFIYATLAGLAVADIVGINIVEAIASLANFQSSPGRMRLLEGINATTIIDDTYNASPRSMTAALNTLKVAPGSRKIAILGDMKELGHISTQEHIEIAKQLKKMNIDIIFLIGKEMKVAYDELKNNSKKIKVKYYEKGIDVKDDVVNIVSPGDVILLKGSRSMKLEQIVATLVTDKSQTLCI